MIRTHIGNEGRRAGVFVALFMLISAVVAQTTDPVLNTDMSGESHLIKGRDMIKFESGFRYEIPAAQVDNTFVAYFDHDEFLLGIGGSLNSASGFGIDNSGEVGGTAGAFNVAASGAAKYSIPIIVSPGTNGMEPNLSIAYNSQAPDGLLGKGFSLRGMSSVTRGPATDYHDGANDQVDFDDEDRLILDGERLVLISGDYGKDGSEYRLENNRMAKVVGSGNDESSGWVEAFIVYEKSGLIKTYGTSGSAVRAIEGSTELGIHTWCLRKVQDRAGNYMTYHYTVTDQEYVLDEIRYTGNGPAGLATFASVVFEYEERATSRIAFLYGHKMLKTKRLKNIKSYYGSSLVRDYRLAYETYDNMPHLISVTEYNSAGEHFNPILFDWNEDSTGPAQTSSSHQIAVMVGGSNQSQNVFNLPGDYTGDGKTDVLSFNRFYAYAPAIDQTEEHASYTLYEEVDGEMISTFTSADPRPNWRKYSGDFNGDGMLDFIAIKPVTDDRKYEVYLFDKGSSYGGHSFQIAHTGSLPNHDWVQLGDFDGDGKTDILAMEYILPTSEGDPIKIQGTITYAHLTVVNAFSSEFGIFYNGQGFSSLLTWEGPWADPPTGLEFVLGDFNADGKTDIYSGLPLDDGDGRPALLIHGPNRGEVFLWRDAEWPDFSDALADRKAIAGDFNGDGILDILIKEDKSRTVQEDIGDCTICPAEGTCESGRCIVENVEFYWDLYLGNGRGYTKVETNAAGSEANSFFTGDFNGDGKTDLAGQTDNALLLNTFDGIHTFRSLDYISVDDAQVLVGDFTGNGTTDILGLPDIQPNFLNTVTCGSGATPPTCDEYSYDQSFILHADYRAAPTMVKAIANSFGSRIYLEYLPLTDSEVYSKYSSIYDELLDVQFPMQVVRKVYADNGIGGLAETRYQYRGAVAHRYGKGYLGFQKVITEDITQGIETTQTFSINRNHYHSVLTAASTKSLITGAQLSHTSVSYTALDDGLAGTFLLAKDTETTLTFDPYTEAELSKVITSYDQYDAYGNVEQMTVTTDVDGPNDYQTQTVNTYTAANLSEWVLGQVETVTVTQTAPGKPNSVRTASYTYNSDYFPETETVQPGHELELVTSYTYDAFGNILSTTATGRGGGPGSVDQSRRVVLTYDDNGRFVETQANAFDHTSTSVYNPVFGNVTSETGPNGLTTSYTYDAFGRLNQVNTPNSNVVVNTAYGWVNGNASAPPNARYYVDEITSGSPTVRTFYDRLNRPLRARTTNWAAQVVFADTDYNEKGQTYRGSDPYFSGDQPLWTYQEFDEVGRATKVVAPGGRETTNSYTGLIATTLNARGYESEAEVNALGQQIRSTDAKGNSLTYDYHADGNLASIADFAGNVTTFTYDVLGNRTQVIDPDLGAMSTVYNAFGEPVKETNARGNVTTVAYDLLGRMTNRSIQADLNTETTTWLYDTKKVGMPTSATVGTISKEYFYDNLLRVKKVREQLDGTIYDVATTFDALGRPEVLTYPDVSGFEVEYNYNNGFLTSVSNPADPTEIYWELTQENARGQLKAFSLASGAITTEREFSKHTGLISQIVSKKGTEKTQNDYYEFDALNNLTKRVNYLADQGRGLEEVFNYDKLNRLDDYHITGKIYGNVDMTYDDLGNITLKSDVGDYRYELSQPHAVSEIVQQNPVTHQDISYTGFEKVQTITEGDPSLDGATIDFTYGVDHERKITTTTVAGVTLTKRFIGGLYEEEENDSGQLRKVHYIKARGEAIAIYTEDEGLGTQATHYLLKDHLGSISAIADEQGNVLERYSFDAWGKRRDAETWQDLDGATNVSYARGFTGHEHLELFSLINMNGRMYDPVVGRFLSADPYTQSPDFTQGLNRYSYVFNNPLSFTDPSGYVAFPIITLPAMKILAAVTITASKISGAIVAAKILAVATVATAAYLSVSAAVGQASTSAALFGSSTPRHHEYTYFKNDDTFIIHGKNSISPPPPQVNPPLVNPNYPPPQLNSIGASPLSTSTPQLPSSVGQVASPIQSAASQSTSLFDKAASIAYEINKWNPLANVVNAFHTYFTGVDTFGVAQSNSDATFQLVTSLPIMKVGKVGKLLRKLLSKRPKVPSFITTNKGFLFGSVTVKAPFDIPVQRFGNMNLGRPDFWGIRIGSSKFANRVFGAILPKWNNLSQYTVGVIPKGTPMKFGIIGPQGLIYPGGSLQFLTESRNVINQSSKLILR